MHLVQVQDGQVIGIGLNPFIPQVPELKPDLKTGNNWCDVQNVISIPIKIHLVMGQTFYSLLVSISE